jgi:hypothetical protein
MTYDPRSRGAEAYAALAKELCARNDRVTADIASNEVEAV